MASIDERVVAMSFENAKFEQGVAQTMATLAKLNEALAKIGTDSGLSKIEAESHKITLTAPLSAIERLKARLSGITAGRVFGDIEGASDKVSFGGILGALEKVKARLGFPEAKAAFADLSAADDKVSFAEANSEIEKTAGHFSIITGAAAVAFGNLATQAAAGVTKAVGASLNAIKDGFSDYETKIGATQTIMAGTGEDIHTVSMYLKELDDYADRTIYSLTDMTSNIGKFTNAGVDLETAVNAMKGISNEAALSGANAGEAARAMYNFGQAIGSGVVRLQDWRSIDLANMGTKEFKEQLIDAAVALGTLKKGNDGTVRSLKGNVVNYKNFNATLQDQWLTSEALTKTLAKYSDETTNLGKRAYSAASDVKTVSMMIQTLSAAAGTAWTDTFEIVLGNLPEATKLWTDLTNAIGSFIGESADARNDALQTWKDLGGRTKLIEALKQAMEALGGILGPIGKGFREIFPRKTGEDLLEMTENFGALMDRLTPSAKTMDLLTRSFAGFFAVLDIGWELIKQVVGLIGDLFGVLGEGSGGFLSITAAIGDWLVALDDAVSKGEALEGLFDTLAAVLSVPLEIIKELTAALFSMFDGTDPKKAEGVASAMDKLNQALKPLRGVLDDVEAGWEKFRGILDKVKEAVEPGMTRVLDFLGGFGQLIADKFNNINWDRALAALQTGLIGGLLLKVKDGFSSLLSVDVGGGILKNLNTGLGALTDNLKAMQRGIQVATLVEIAAAIVLLAGGVLVLSSIPAEKLKKSMEAIAIGLAQLVGAVYLLTIASKGGLGFKIGIIAGSMILLATAVTILAAAMKIMSTMDWDELARGLVGIGVALAAVAGATQLMNGPKIIATGLALIPLAIGLNLLAAAVIMFSRLSWEDLGKGLLGAAGALAVIGMAVYAIPPIALTMGPSLIAIAFGLSVLAGAVGMFGNMDLKTMFQGLLGVGAALAIIGGAMALIPPSSILLGPSLIAIAAGLNLLGAAVAIFGNLDVMTLIKGLGGIGAALAILAGGMYLMQGSIGGAAALLAAAAAFAVLGPAIAFMGQLKWSTLLKGLGAMAAILAVLAIAGAVAAGPLTALGLALAALGAGMLVVSAALSLFVIALAQLGDHGPKAIAAATAAFAAFLLVLPKLIIDFLKGLVVIVAEIVKIAPAIAESLVKIAGTLLDAIVALSPKIAEAIAALVVLIAQVLAENVPKLAAAGLMMILGLLRAIDNSMPRIMETATNVIVGFIQGLGDNAPRIINAGSEMLGKFLRGINIKIPNIVGTVAKLIVTFLNAVTSHIPKVVRSGINLIITFLKQILLAVPRFVKAGVTVVVAFLDGIGDAIPRLVTAGLRLAKRFLFGIADGLAGLGDLGFKTVIRFLNGVEKAIRDNFDDLVTAGIGIADALIDGITQQFGFMAKPLKAAVEKVFDLLPGWAKKILGIHSPSTVFAEIGRNVMLGFITGVENSGPMLQSAMEKGADSVVQTAKTAFGNVPNVLEGIVDMDPVITPVLDLSSVEADAKKLGDLADVVPISAAASFDQASAINVPTASEAEQAAQAGSSFEFNQYNTSPEKLSEIEIYRQTKNQLSQVKGALGLAK